MDLVIGIVDVFADEPLSGNPLAVVEDADGLTLAEMKQIAREFNQAETTFIMRSTSADRKLRSFTAAGAEVVGAGHNALGAWLWLAELGKLGCLVAPQTFRQQIGEEVLPITLTKVDGRVVGRMRQSPLKLLEPLTEVTSLSRALGLLPADIMTSPPPRSGDTGVSHLLVRILDAATVDRAKPASDALLEVLRRAGAEGCYIYALDPQRADRAYARFFNPTVGLWEDAATGTAAGPLAAYLGQQGMLADDTIAIEQGTKMRRKSILNVRLSPTPELSGAGIIVVQGTMRL
jgi:PhzF family phenazine biosynthesis protein